MTWQEQLLNGGMNLSCAAIGGVLVILSERLRMGRETKMRRAENLVEMYAGFMVAFHRAVELNENLCSGIVWEANHNGQYNESKDSEQNRLEAEKRFRELAWRLRFFELVPFPVHEFRFSDRVA